MTKHFIHLLLATVGGLTNPVDLKFEAQPAQDFWPELALTFDDGSINVFDYNKSRFSYNGHS